MPKKRSKHLIIVSSPSGNRILGKYAYTLGMIPLKDIVPSPFQHRTGFNPETLKELGRSIIQDGLFHPILVRQVDERFELIAGERRFRAARDYTDMETIEAKVVEADDIGAQNLSAAENDLREDLSIFETIEKTVAIVDSQLRGDDEYDAMGATPVDRVKTLLAKLDAVRRSELGRHQVANPAKMTSHKFMGSVEKVFKNLPKPLEWRSFYNNDLKLIVETDQEVRRVSTREELNKSQTSALEKLNRVSKDEFEALAQESLESRKKENPPDTPSPRKRRLGDFSAAEINAITEKEIKKQTMAEQDVSRETIPIVSKVKVLLMCRLGIPIDIIASILKINWKTAKKYSQDGALLRSIRDALENGLSVPAAAIKLALPEPLVWAIALEGKNDKDRFDALGWNIRTWDYWYWGKCDQRFGDDWPGRIPAQMIAHILYYFSDQNDLVWDPMAGGGVVADTSLALNRKCRSFDLDDRADTRPEIEPFFWDPNDLKWPITDTTKPDLILFDPPYFQKKAADYDPTSISGLSRTEYLKFLERFFALAHQNAKETTQMAFINADWRDFQGTPARNEMVGNAIMIDDYLHIIKNSGWQRTHILQAPLTSERFNAAAVSAMQKKRIIGVISRYVIMARRAG